MEEAEMIEILEEGNTLKLKNGMWVISITGGAGLFAKIESHDLQQKLNELAGNLPGERGVLDEYWDE